MSYLPEFKGPIEGWTVNFLAKNLWRVERTHTHEEAMQEAFITFMRCAARYPTVETPQHFMALYKTSWINEFNDLSTKATAAKAEVSDRLFNEESEEILAQQIIGNLDNDGFLAVMLRQAPNEVKMVLNLFYNAPTELLQMASAAWRQNGNYKADGDRMVAKMLGLPPDSTPVSDTHDYFSP